MKFTTSLCMLIVVVTDATDSVKRRQLQVGKGEMKTAELPVSPFPSLTPSISPSKCSVAVMAYGDNPMATPTSTLVPGSDEPCHPMSLHHRTLLDTTTPSISVAPSSKPPIVTPQPSKSPMDVPSSVPSFTIQPSVFFSEGSKKQKGSKQSKSGFKGSKKAKGTSTGMDSPSNQPSVIVSKGSKKKSSSKQSKIVGSFKGSKNSKGAATNDTLYKDVPATLETSNASGTLVSLTLDTESSNASRIFFGVSGIIGMMIAVLTIA